MKRSKIENSTESHSKRTKMDMELDGNENNIIIVNGVSTPVSQNINGTLAGGRGWNDCRKTENEIFFEWALYMHES